MSYYIGLDIGTESVGWAVTDEKYKVCKRNGKALWGVRLFDEAQVAAERRINRVARRRIQRRKQRLAWLQDVFSGEIGAVDPAFFQRLSESFFREEDKQGDFNLGKFSLFNDENYTDREFYAEFKSIYHLRYAIISQNRPFDPRLIYLAIHHIMKKRGHSLYDDLSLDAINLDFCMSELNSYLKNIYDCELTIADREKFEEILTNRGLNKSRRKSELLKTVNVEKEQKMLKALTELLAGASVKFKSLFGEEIEAKENVTLDCDFEAEFPKILLAVGEENTELIRLAKRVYDWALLAKMRSGMEFISEAKVKSYEKHGSDLRKLRKIIKEQLPESYDEIFNVSKDKLDNYTAYSGFDNDQRKKCSYDDFRKFLKGKLTKIKLETSEITTILEELETGEFLQKQSISDNGTIPYQLHKAELSAILENACEYLPFLSEIGESGLTHKEEIMQMFEFRIPYYIGPLFRNENSPFSWVERTDEKIYPWNFERVVDLEKSAENFITRMTAKCSYIGEDVLPKDSLLYSKFSVLNELNNLKINSVAIPVELKQKIYNDQFLSGKKVTGKKLKSYLKSEGYITDKDELSGFDADFKSTLSAYSAFADVLAKPNSEEMVEEIIRHIVLFGDDKKLLKSWLIKTYGDKLSEDEQRNVLARKFSGWGRLSSEFLTKIYHPNADTGEVSSIIDLMWSTNNNLMELLSGRFSFTQAIKDYKKDKYADKIQSLSDYLDESYASPSIKRAITQTIKITDEIVKIMKAQPTKVFVEVAREDGEKKRTVSRKNKIELLYKNCGEEADFLYQKLEEETDGTLRRDKLYLYYTQLGRCMYSGEIIELSQLDSGYDIDHIYPQSVTKDDSLNNRVLVKRELNAKKSDKFPLPSEMRTNMSSWWHNLKEKGFITKEKYNRLIRPTELSDDELASFVARQLVETRQSTKIVAEILKSKFAKSEIVYSKAKHVSEFRQNQRVDENGDQKQANSFAKNTKTAQDPLFVKCRDVNDFHHAKDAYLNIVVGNVYNVKFTKSPQNFIKDNRGTYSLNRMYDFDVKRGQNTAWVSGEDGSIAQVRATMRKNNILFTRMAREVTGALFDLQIVKAGSGQAPIKSSDLRMSIKDENGKLLYGGYNKISGAYFFLVEHTSKKKKVRSIETVFLMHKKLYENNPVEYCEKILELKDAKILIPKIRLNSLFEYDGFKMHISGRDGDSITFYNANQVIISNKDISDIKNIYKYLDRCKDTGRVLDISKYDGISLEINIGLYDALLKKLDNRLYSKRYNKEIDKLKNGRSVFLTLSLRDQCYVISQILTIIKCNKVFGDLRLINGVQKEGRIRPSKNITGYKCNSLKIINQSITGFFENEVDLLSEDLSL